MKRREVEVESCGDVMSRWWRSGAVTKALMIGGILAALLYVVGDVVSGVLYDRSRPYSFKDQWISELTALGSPVRPLMVTVIIAHDILLIAFGVGIWRVAGGSRSRRWVGLGLVGTTALGIFIHPFFPMTSRWLEPGFTDTMHGATTFPWGLGIFVIVVLGAIAYRGWFRVYSIATLIILVVFGAASSVAIQGIEQNDSHGRERSSASTPTASWCGWSPWP